MSIHLAARQINKALPSRHGLFIVHNCKLWRVINGARSFARRHGLRGTLMTLHERRRCEVEQIHSTNSAWHRPKSAPRCGLSKGPTALQFPQNPKFTASSRKIGQFYCASLVPPFQNKPKPFFELVIHDSGGKSGLTGACAGYEQGRFRNQGLADYLFEWLPEFALKYSELEEFNSGSAMRLVRQAAKTVYTTEKYKTRGEFGELLLHALLREVFNSEPAISKIFYKTSANDTVKGFDAVHIVENGSDLELWLGEVKFYQEAGAAVCDITKEIVAHTASDYLRQEFILIGGKLDSRWNHCDKVRDLISQRKSLDEVFTRLCIPALITYESKCVAANCKLTEDFREALRVELRGIAARFSQAKLPDLRIHLFLVPLHEKQTLVKLLHEKLEGLQR